MWFQGLNGGSRMNKELISIIVPIYNVEDSLKKCIESILNQTYTNLEIILVDDGSPDKCGQICDWYKEKDARIRVVHKRNGGLSDARNVGIEIASGRYIGFVDSDDYIEPDMYSLLLHAINRESAQIACCGIIREFENGESSIIRTPHIYKTYTSVEAIKECLFQNEIGISVWCKLYKREIFDNIRFPVGETNEDAAILLETLSRGNIVHIGKPMYHYVVRENSITASFSETKNAFVYNNALNIKKYIDSNYKKISYVGKAYLAYCLLGILLMYPKKYKSMESEQYIREYKKIWYYIFVVSGLSFKRKIRSVILRIQLVKK